MLVEAHQLLINTKSTAQRVPLELQTPWVSRLRGWALTMWRRSSASTRGSAMTCCFGGRMSGKLAKRSSQVPRIDVHLSSLALGRLADVLASMGEVEKARAVLLCSTASRWGVATGGR